MDYDGRPLKCAKIVITRHGSWNEYRKKFLTCLKDKEVLLVGILEVNSKKESKSPNRKEDNCRYIHSKQSTRKRRSLWKRATLEGQRQSHTSCSFNQFQVQSRKRQNCSGNLISNAGSGKPDKKRRNSKQQEEM